MLMRVILKVSILSVVASLVFDDVNSESRRKHHIELDKSIK